MHLDPAALRGVHVDAHRAPDGVDRVIVYYRGHVFLRLATPDALALADALTLAVDADEEPAP